MHINDLMFQKLGDLGYPGALTDRINAFKAANAPWTGWDGYLAREGYTTGALSDRKFQYFDELVTP